MSVQEFLKKIPTLDPSEHPSADDVLAREGKDFSLKGKVILVTGGSTGIGAETVRAFASKGAKVLVAVRDIEKTKAVIDSIKAAHRDHGDLEIVKLELDSLASVKAAADYVTSHTDQLNILVNNAGVMNAPYELTKDGHELQFGVNHLGHFLLFRRLLPLLLKSSTPEFQSRVVNLSSRAHLNSGVDVDDLHWTKRGYKKTLAYGQSKTANILMAREIERRYAGQGVHAWAVHPGGILTDLARHTTLEDYIQIGLSNEKGELARKGFKLKSIPQGAATTVWAAVAKELEGKGGEYLEDVHISRPVKEGDTSGGYAPHGYDEEVARKLWEYSEQAVREYDS